MSKASHRRLGLRGAGPTGTIFVVPWATLDTARMADLKIKAEDFGSCQHRDRLYMVATRDDNDKVLSGIMAKVGATESTADVPLPSWATKNH